MLSRIELNVHFMWWEEKIVRKQYVRGRANGYLLTPQSKTTTYVKVGFNSREHCARAASSNSCLKLSLSNTPDNLCCSKISRCKRRSLEYPGETRMLCKSPKILCSTNLQFVAMLITISSKLLLPSRSASSRQSPQRGSPWAESTFDKCIVKNLTVRRELAVWNNAFNEPNANVSLTIEKIEDCKCHRYSWSRTLEGQGHNFGCPI